MDQHNGAWWDSVLTWLQEQAIPLLTAGVGILLGQITRAMSVRTGISEMRQEWRLFLERYEAAEKERSEFRTIQSDVFDDLCKRLARLEERVEEVSRESLDEQRRLFRLLRQDGRGQYGG